MIDSGSATSFPARTRFCPRFPILGFVVAAVAVALFSFFVFDSSQVHNAQTHAHTHTRQLQSTPKAAVQTGSGSELGQWAALSQCTPRGRVRRLWQQQISERFRAPAECQTFRLAKGQIKGESCKKDSK